MLLLGFDFKDIKGAISPRKNALKLDEDVFDVKEKLSGMKYILTKEFDFPPITDIRWERKRDHFIECISSLQKTP